MKKLFFVLPWAIAVTTNTPQTEYLIQFKGQTISACQSDVKQPGKCTELMGQVDMLNLSYISGVQDGMTVKPTEPKVGHHKAESAKTGK